MTCIVGLETEHGVLLGADSAASNNDGISIRNDTKLFRSGPFTIGFTTSYRMGQLLRYSLNVGAPDTWDVDRFMATTFVNAVRQTLEDGGVETGGTFLVGIAGRLYGIFDDFQISHAAAGFESVGSGGAYALGSLHTSAGLDWDPRQRVIAALEAAAALDPFVAPPFLLEFAPTDG